ncbi:MAG: DHH family phosphoesterase [Flavobacteriales bacterium]|nr:DHH family phosphoesterase [Flavobacteriales bacterium]
MKGVFEEDKVAAAGKLIANAGRIVISTHKSPDGDAVGSSLALALYLKKCTAAEVFVVVPDAYPDFLSWIPGQEIVLIMDDAPDRVAELISTADVIFTLDYNSLKRCGDVGPLLENVDCEMIMIDHHQAPESYARVTFSDVSSCSTAQMVYQFIESRGDVALIDNEIAQGIYCGIMTDTGSFRFPSVSPYTHQIAARLIENGLDHSAIHRAVYDTNLEDRLKLLGYALSQKLDVYQDLRTAVITLTAEELKAHHHRQGDTEGLVNYALSIKGINLAVFIREGNNNTRMSFRSKGQFNVNEFARAHFNGGGHNNAAGGMSEESVEQTYERLRAILPDYRNQLDYE